MANDGSSDNGRHVWGLDHREAGIKLVVAVVDDATAALLREAAGAGEPHEWGDPRRLVAEPGPGGIARVMTSNLYQNLIALTSDLMVFDPAVADEGAWDVLCDYFSTCGPTQERILLLCPLPLPEVPDENVTIIVAPAGLTAQYLRQQMIDAPGSPRDSEFGESPVETVLLLQVEHYESFAAGSRKQFIVRSDSQDRCYAANAPGGPWRALSGRSAKVAEAWSDVLATKGVARLFDEYSAKCRHEEWTPHPDILTIGLTVGGRQAFRWSGDCGCIIRTAALPSGIIGDFISAMECMDEGKQPPEVPVEYQRDLEAIKYAGEGRGARAVMADIVTRASLSVWAEHRHDWWTLLDVAGSTESLESFLKSLSDNGIDWREELSAQEVAEAEGVLQSKGVKG